MKKQYPAGESFVNLASLAMFALLCSGSIVAAAPAIDVQQPLGISLIDGGSIVDFGIAATGGSGTAKTFSIFNLGAANLSGIIITKDGLNSSNFTVNTSGMSTTVAPGSNTTFKVTFVPNADGVLTAAIHVASNDPSKSPFDISLVGEGRTFVVVSLNNPSDTGPTTKGLNAAGLVLNVNLGFAPAPGTQLVAVNNTSPDPVSGFFRNAPDGGTIPITIGGQTFFFLVRYDGGDGNDVVLKAVDWGHLNLGGCGMVLLLKRDPRITNATHLYIGSDVAGIWRSKNAGTSWEQLTPWRMLDTQDWFPDPTDAQGFFVASQKGVWRVSGDGYSWNQYGTFPSGEVCALGGAVDTATTNLVMYAGVGNARYKNIPSGFTAGLYKRIGAGAWSLLSVTVSSTTLTNAVVGLEVNPANPNQLWICGPQGVFYSLNGGTTWELRTNGLPKGNVNRILVNPGYFSDDSICVVENGGVFRWNGGIWLDLSGAGGTGPLPTATPWQSLAWDSAFPFGERLLVITSGTSTGACYYTQNGNTNTPVWSERSAVGTQPYGWAPGASPNACVLYSNTGFVARSAAVKSPNLTLSSAGSYYWRAMYSQVNGSNALNQTLWTERGFQNTVAAAIAASPVDPNRIMVGSFDIGMWLTTNGGVSWANKSPIRASSGVGTAGAVAFSPLDPTKVYCGGRDTVAGSPGNSAIKFSSDSGETWTDISSATFPGYNNAPQDFAFAPDGTLFVAANPESPFTTEGGVWMRITSPSPDWACIGLSGKACRSVSLAPFASDRILVGTLSSAGVYYGRYQANVWSFTRILNTSTECWHVRGV
ncbi:MAG: choice-of-anchor D domain-containing protein [Verrucomicrobiota bacterium]